MPCSQNNLTSCQVHKTTRLGSLRLGHHWNPYAYFTKQDPNRLKVAFQQEGYDEVVQVSPTFAKVA